MRTFHFSRGVLFISTLAVLSCCLSSTVSAQETPWAEGHPRRAQVLQRLENQKIRIAVKVRTGEMSSERAAELLAKGRQIRDEERLMAAQHGGHLTKAEQDVLNQHEDTVSREIGD